MKKVMLLCIIFGVFYASVHADTFGGGRKDNGDVSVFFTQSVRNSAEYRQVFTSAMNNWNNIRSNVSLTRVFSDQNVGTFVAVENTNTPDLLGEMRPFIRRSNGSVVQDSTAINSNWVRTDVIIFANRMNEHNMTRNQKISNATHEFGHSLKLAHPGWLWPWQGSVMKQGIQSIGPQGYDEDELLSKWGQ